MTILVTGATGFLGGAITQELLAQGQPVRILLRNVKRRVTPDFIKDVEVAEGDLLDPASLARAMEGVTRVFHAAGIISFNRDLAEYIYRVNTEGAVNLFRAAQAAKVKRLVYTGSIFALGYTEDPDELVTEEHEFNAPHLLDIPYIRAKVDAETAAQQAITLGLHVIRLYPGLCMGPGDHRRSSTAMIDFWLQGRLPAIIDGGGIPIIDVRDAAMAHLAAMERGTFGRRYIAAGTNITLTDLFERMSQLTDQPAPGIRMSSTVGVPLARVTSRLGVLRAIQPDEARLMAHHWYFSNRRAIGELGVRFRQLETTFVEMIDWLQRHRIFN